MKAPVVIFSYNRPEHLDSILKSLSSCEFANETKVYLYIDGPRNRSDKQAQTLFDSIIDRYRFIFLEFVVYKRKKNVGLRKSLIAGITELLHKYDRIIVLEDDLELSPNFLAFMNDSLTFYENQLEVSSVSGYTNAISSVSDFDNYFHLRPCSWGWATWANRWDKVDWDYKPKNNLEWCKLWWKCKFVGDDIFRMFRQLHLKKNNSWAISWTIHNIISKKYASYPKVSKVKNIGFGELATHCKSDNPFLSNYKISTGKKFLFSSVVKASWRDIVRFNWYFSNLYKLLFKLGFRFGKS